jgi:hypothetical protein
MFQLGYHGRKCILILNRETKTKRKKRNPFRMHKMADLKMLHVGLIEHVHDQYLKLQPILPLTLAALNI